MFSEVFLAVTGREMAEFTPQKTAYLSCHFSPYGSGLSNLPAFLPKDSLLLVDDRMPPKEHDPNIVAKQLKEVVENFSVKCILLDFQNAPTEETEAMARHLVNTLSCSVGVTKEYGKKLQCPVFLPPPPLHTPIEKYLTPWLKQGVYLEIAPESIQITVTKDGAEFSPIPYIAELPLYHKRLCCHYQVEVLEDKAIFTLTRSKKDLIALVQKVEQMGALGVVGLYQELKGI